MKKSQPEYSGMIGRKLIIDNNRRLQEITQQLLMTKLELEKNNQELRKARLEGAEGEGAAAE